MILHFQRIYSQRASGACGIDLCFGRSAIKAMSGMALAGDLGCFRIDSPAAAGLRRSRRRVTGARCSLAWFAFPDLALRSIPAVATGVGQALATNGSSLTTLYQDTQRERKWGAQTIDRIQQNRFDRRRRSCPRRFKIQHSTQ